MRTHPLEDDLNADAADFLSAIQKGFRAIIDVWPAAGLVDTWAIYDNVGEAPKLQEEGP